MFLQVLDCGDAAQPGHRFWTGRLLYHRAKATTPPCSVTAVQDAGRPKLIFLWFLAP